MALLLSLLVLALCFGPLSGSGIERIERLLETGDQFERQNEFFKALQAYRQALEKAPMHEGALLRLTRLLYRIGRIDEAFETARAALKSAPNHSRLRLELAYLLQTRARLEEAGEQIDLALKTLQDAVTPNDPILVYGLHLLGRNLLGKGHLEAGEKQLLRVVEIKPDFPEAHVNLGELYSRQPENYERAIRHFQTALDLRPELFIAYRELGKIFLNLGRPAEAAESFQKAIEQNPDSSEAHYLLAAAFRTQGEIDRARAALDSFERLKTQEPFGTGRQMRSRALTLEGEEHLIRNELDMALQLFQQAVEAFPDDLAFYGVSRVFLGKKMPRQAYDAIRRAVALDPFNPAYHAMAAACLEQLNDLPNAIQALQLAILINPRVAEYQNGLGDLFVRAEEFERAVEAYQRATELEPEYPLFRQNLSSALAKTGDLERSQREKEVYLQLLARSPD